MGSYSRESYLAIKKETTEGTAVTPDVFVPLMSEDIVTEWGDNPAQPVTNNRSLNIRSVETAIPAPTGTITVQLEPVTVGHFFHAVGGSISSGEYMPITSASGDFTVGETVTGGTSTETATVVISSTEQDYVIVSGSSGGFTDGETITGGTSGSSATLTKHNQLAFAHEITVPQSSLPTYTVEFGFTNEAYRYTGVRFNAITFNQSDNIITAEITITARYEFKMARVTEITSSAAGSQTITVDQTTGLAASDTIKLYRPSTSSFQDFEAADDKVHTIDSVDSETTFSVTNLETATAVGDLIVLAPQTPSYSVANELAWIGQSVVTLDTTIDNVITNATTESIEDFEITVENAIEARHAADGNNVKDRFPANNFLMGLTGTGSLTRTYTNMEFLDKLRDSRRFAGRIQITGSVLPNVSDFNYTIDLRVPDALYDPFNPSISEDDLLNQEMPFKMYYSSDDSYLFKALIVNEETAY